MGTGLRRCDEKSGSDPVELTQEARRDSRMVPRAAATDHHEPRAMSDIGLNFSALDILGIGAILALPVTTIILVILVALRLRARGSGWGRGGR
jgi:hypothetical protein